LLALSRDQKPFVLALAALGDTDMRRRLEVIGDRFLEGYHASLEEERLQALGDRLERMDLAVKGFAYEGAGLGLTLRDCLQPWRRRFAAFLRGPGGGQTYMLHVGAGWALARLPVSTARFLDRFDPLLRWLALDGFGFHEAFYRWPRTVEARRWPARLHGYARRPFDVGVGRRLWFAPETEAGLLRIVNRFPEDRQGDLWAGIGAACAFAGGRPQEFVAGLRQAAGRFAPQLGQGATFAAKTRIRGGGFLPHTELACRLFCGRSAAEAAALTDEALVDLPADGEIPAFEVWRRRIQERLREPSGLVPAS
jgi:hypothetical protein